MVTTAACKITMTSMETSTSTAHATPALGASYTTIMTTVATPTTVINTVVDTVISTVTQTVTGPAAVAIAKRGTGYQTWTATRLPLWASVLCSGASQYSSAYSCAGVTQSTITLPLLQPKRQRCFHPRLRLCQRRRRRHRLHIRQQHSHQILPHLFKPTIHEAIIRHHHHSIHIRR